MRGRLDYGTNGLHVTLPEERVTIIVLNRFCLGADVRITTGFVEPHFFAGFSGGPKMVAPGLAGLETVMTLHDAARIAHPAPSVEEGRD